MTMITNERWRDSLIREAAMKTGRDAKLWSIEFASVERRIEARLFSEFVQARLFVDDVFDEELESLSFDDETWWVLSRFEVGSGGSITLREVIGTLECPPSKVGTRLVRRWRDDCRKEFRSVVSAYRKILPKIL